MSDALLDLDAISVSYPSRKWKAPPFLALDRFSLRIEADRPRIIAIVGESGSGKTTLARVVLGMLPPTGGRMNYAGKSITQMSKPQRASFRREVQAIFQDPFAIFNPFYPVDHLLEMPLRIFGIAKSRAEERDMIETALERVGLRPEQVLGRHPHQLSGGQRQRIVVARSLMLRPRLIVADEPVSMIDASLRANVLSQIQALRDDLGVSIIYITHDIATARQVSDEVFVLNQGKTVESGTAEAVISNPQHPYTRLLVGSVPRPDPDHGWSDLSGQLEDQP
jgi:ABC-type glutathione transport system ATPase component